MLENWIEWVTKIEDTHGTVVGLLKYILRESGGLLWPLAYGIILWQSWDNWNTFGQIISVMFGCILTIISILYPITWRRYIKKRELLLKGCHKNILDSYNDFIDILEQLDLWQTARNKNLEGQLLEKNKNLQDTLQCLKNLT